MIIKLTDNDVRITMLPPFTVASYTAIGAMPESEAWCRLYTWAQDHGLFNELETSRFFGFNNPAPSGYQSWYGYEAWMTLGSGTGVSAHIRSSEGIEVKKFEGGVYAVTRSFLRSSRETWMSLIEWNILKGNTLGGHQGLEEHLSRRGTAPEDFELDLYLPVNEVKPEIAPVPVGEVTIGVLYAGQVREDPVDIMAGEAGAVAA